MPYSFDNVFNDAYYFLAFLNPKDSKLNQISKTDKASLNIPIVEAIISFLTAFRYISYQPVGIRPQMTVLNKVTFLYTTKNVVDGVLR